MNNDFERQHDNENISEAKSQNEAVNTSERVVNASPESASENNASVKSEVVNNTPVNNVNNGGYGYYSAPSGNMNGAAANGTNMYGDTPQNGYAQQPNGNPGGFNPYGQPYNGYRPPVMNNPYNVDPQYAKPEKKKKKGGMGALKIIALALCFSLIGGILGAGGLFLASKAFDGVIKLPGNTTTVLQGSRPNTVIDINTIDTSKVMTAAEIYAANVNSTVGITTSITTNFFGYQTTSAASGSGFVLTADGYIITNHHVIEGATKIKVTTYGGESYTAKLIGYDQSNDLAVLKIEAKDLSPVVIGDSDNMNVGDNVVAIGNPLGELTFSLTAGAVSALNREITLSSGITMDLIQTDCAINSGNSGGALFNMYGEVVGITNAKYSSNSSSGQASIDNIGFAIPMNNVKKIIESIIEKGYIAKPYIGVSVGDVSSQAQAYGLPAGAAVDSVTENGPASKAGVKANDIITAVDGKKITTSNELVEIISAHEPGDKIKLTVYRQGKVVEIEVEVGEQIQDTTTQEQNTQRVPIYPFG